MKEESMTHLLEHSSRGRDAIQEKAWTQCEGKGRDAMCGKGRDAMCGKGRDVMCGKGRDAMCGKGRDAMCGKGRDAMHCVSTNRIHNSKFLILNSNEPLGLFYHIATHVRDQCLRDFDALRGLVVLQQSRHDTRQSQGATIQRVA